MVAFQIVKLYHVLNDITYFNLLNMSYSYMNLVRESFLKVTIIVRPTMYTFCVDADLVRERMYQVTISMRPTMYTSCVDVDLVRERVYKVTIIMRPTMYTS